MASLNPLTTTDWLAINIDRPDVKILDGTWVMPGESDPLPNTFIPGSQYFDIDVIADLSSSMKHMMPSPLVFADAISTMGIKNEDMVVIYDRHGTRTSPRVWWTFRAFGHENVTVLDGGLPAWIRDGHPTVNTYSAPESRSQYTARSPLSGVTSQSELISQLGSNLQILDARPTGRFFGTTPEPRAGLRSGHIPGSKTFPFGSVINEDGTYKSPEEIKALAETAEADVSKPIVTTCGSGVTAAGIGLALYLIGAKDVSIYDGSWTEWGASNAPISLDK